MLSFMCTMESRSYRGETRDRKYRYRERSRSIGEESPVRRRSAYSPETNRPYHHRYRGGGGFDRRDRRDGNGRRRYSRFSNRSPSPIYTRRGESPPGGNGRARASRFTNRRDEERVEEGHERNNHNHEAHLAPMAPLDQQNVYPNYYHPPPHELMQNYNAVVSMEEQINMNRQLAEAPAPAPSASTKVEKEPDEDVVQKLLDEMKQKGLVDKFRRNYIEHCESRPDFIALRNRVDKTVRQFIGTITWTPELNRNTGRDLVRRRVVESSYFAKDMDAMLDKCCAEAEKYFMPTIEEAVYNFLGIEKPAPPEIPNQNESDSGGWSPKPSPTPMDIATSEDEDAAESEENREEEDEDDEAGNVDVEDDKVVLPPPPPMPLLGQFPMNYYPSLIPGGIGSGPSLIPHFLPNMPPLPPLPKLPSPVPPPPPSEDEESEHPEEESADEGSDAEPEDDQTPSSAEGNPSSNSSSLPLPPGEEEIRDQVQSVAVPHVEEESPPPPPPGEEVLVPAPPSSLPDENAAVQEALDPAEESCTEKQLDQFHNFEVDVLLPDSGCGDPAKSWEALAALYAYGAPPPPPPAAESLSDHFLTSSVDTGEKIVWPSYDEIPLPPSPSNDSQPPPPPPPVERRLSDDVSPIDSEDEDFLAQIPLPPSPEPRAELSLVEMETGSPLGRSDSQALVTDSQAGLPPSPAVAEKTTTPTIREHDLLPSSLPALHEESLIPVAKPADSASSTAELEYFLTDAAEEGELPPSPGLENLSPASLCIDESQSPLPSSSREETQRLSPPGETTPQVEIDSNIVPKETPFPVTEDRLPPISPEIQKAEASISLELNEQLPPAAAAAMQSAEDSLSDATFPVAVPETREVEVVEKAVETGEMRPVSVPMETKEMPPPLPLRLKELEAEEEEDDDWESPAFEKFEETSPPRVEALIAETLTPPPKTKLKEEEKKREHTSSSSTSRSHHKHKKHRKSESDLKDGGKESSSSSSRRKSSSSHHHKTSKESKSSRSHQSSKSGSTSSSKPRLSSISSRREGEEQRRRRKEEEKRRSRRNEDSSRRKSGSTSNPVSPPVESSVESKEKTPAPESQSGVSVLLFDGEELPVLHYLEPIPSLQTKMKFYSKYTDPLLMDEEVSLSGDEEISRGGVSCLLKE